MEKLFRGTARLVLPLCFTLCGAGIGLAQNTNSGDIRGTVTDATGAVMPGVTVTLDDVDKNVTHTYVTDGAGLYDTGSIVPDHYTVAFTKPGFTTYVRGPITLQVGISTVNGHLTVGATTQTVTVNTDIPLLDTESGSQSTTLTSKTMLQLPQVGADWENFVILLPGTSGSPENSSNALNPGQVASMNGNLPYNSMLADGATTTLPMSQNSDVMVFETVSEVKISDSAFSAQYGIGGAIFNQISKGGTDQFHGVGYEYFQNNALNANPYAFGAKGATVPILRYNNFGFSVGGPILKKRMFFYFNYDKTIDYGGASNGFINIPTAAMQSGDFTGLPTIYDPTTQTVTMTANGPVVTRKSFADEYGNGNKIPASMIDPVAKALQSYYPKPNQTGIVVNGFVQNNYFYNVPSSNPFIKYFGRLDYDVTSHNRITASETSSDNPATYLNQGLCPINCQHGDVSRDNAQISDVWTIRPDLINEARIGFTDQLNFFTPYSINEGFPAKLGWQFAKADVFPNIGLTDEYGFSSSTNAVYKEFVFDPSDVVTLIHGRHVLHFGGEILINRADSTAWGNINAGSMNYTGAYTSSNGTPGASTGGIDYADFLLGQTNNWNAQVTPEFGGRWKSPQAFVQDDIKVRPNLTVNIGLRYEIETGWSEVKGNEAVFDPTIYNSGSQSYGAMWYGTSANQNNLTLINDHSSRKSLQAPVYSIFLPRLGFSYLIRPNMTIRGGFGIYADSWSEDTYGGGMGNAFGSSGNDSDQTSGVCPIVQLSGTGDTPDTVDPGCAAINTTSINSKYLNSPTLPTSRNGQGVTYNQYHTPVPTNYQWNLTVQRELSPNIIAEISYVGNKGTNLQYPGDVNQVPENLLSATDASYIPHTGTPTNPNGTPTATNGLPYPQYQGIGGSFDVATSNYNALQATIQKRFTSGLEFNFNYTWSHFNDEQDSSGWGSREGYQPVQNMYVPHSNYGPSNFDIRNMLKGSVIYQLPVGKGQRFLNNSLILDDIIGGWQASATVNYQSGNPFTVTTAQYNSSFNQSGNYSQYPNTIGDPHSGPHGTIKEWFNNAAFAVPAPATYGNTHRNSLYGPNLDDVNFSLGKNFILWPARGLALQIRADATNVLNHPSFGQPNTNIGPGYISNITGVTVGGRAMQLYGRISF